MALISGVQQIGIGCADASKTFKWLRKTFGLNVKIFDDEAKAELMTRYTGGDVHISYEYERRWRRRNMAIYQQNI
jgi:hypothetical protein